MRPAAAGLGRIDVGTADALVKSYLELRGHSLGCCADFIATRLSEARDVLRGTRFKDPVPGLFALQDRLDVRAGSRAVPGSVG